MWQRIQTVYLLISFIVVGIMSFFPILSIEGNEGVFELSVYGLMREGTSGYSWSWPFPLIIFSTLISLLSLVIVFTYKKRSLQLGLGRLSYLLHLGMIVYVSFTIGGAIETIDFSEITGVVKPSYQYSYFAPIASVVFIFLALRAIRKDEELVKSLDRLR